MSQHDFDIANQPADDARADINNALKALASLSSGSTEPSTTYANTPWYDTSTTVLKMRSEADDAWISMFYLNQSTDTLALFDDTLVVDSSGTQTGLLGDQATSVWEAGTGTTESLVSPAKVKSAIDASNPIKAFASFDGSTAIINHSSNIASIVRSAAGRYTVTFTNALSTPNYIVNCSAVGTGSGSTLHAVLTGSVNIGTTPSTSSFELAVGETGGSGSVGRYADSPLVHFSVIA